MRFWTLTLVLLTPLSAVGKARILKEGMHHLRAEGPREWLNFPKKPLGAALEVPFVAKVNQTEQTLCLRQQDVKQQWQVMLNGKSLGRLVRDENDMTVYFAIAPGRLRNGNNVIRIEQPGRRPTVDDIRVGEITLDPRPMEKVLHTCTVEMTVIDRDGKKPLPARLTIVNANGSLQTTGAQSNDHLAVRPGVVYTSTGKAKIPLPPGTYTIYAGRGFECSVSSQRFEISSGQRLSGTLQIHREVPTNGYVACDTHVHTLTHSGHGDSTVEERMITLAAEGIELPIATDHNVHIDHRPFAKKMKVSRYFTPVIGNEVTTKIGHFNIFPVRAGAKVPNYKLTSWTRIVDDIFRTPDVKVVILNHARDLHSGVRPFGPKLHLSATGRNLNGWKLRANAMEVINSAAIQTKPLQLLEDWMTLLNRGHFLTPVGSSDSHDVARHFVGQGRTYIRCDDRSPGNIDVDQAVNNFLQGRVMVSYGLAVDLKVRDRYGPGEMAPVPDEKVTVSAKVLGPHWTQANRIVLYANGRKIREEAIQKGKRLPQGIQWQGSWTLDRPTHDVHLVAIATGPGIEHLYWRTAKPYQPDNPDSTTMILGSSGAIWLDGDGNGRRSSARDYAERLFHASKGSLNALLTALASYDEAISTQAAELYHLSKNQVLDPELQKALKKAAPQVRTGFQAYQEAWRKSEIARSAP